MLKHRMRIWWHCFALGMAWRLAAGTSREVDGIEVRGLSYEGDGEELTERIIEALQIISAADPGRYERVTDRLPRILVFAYDFSGCAFYSRTADLCVCRPGYLRREPRAKKIALTLVHEAMHAEMDRSGIVAAKNVHQIERMCVSEEIAFVRTLDDRRLLSEARQRWMNVPRIYTSENHLRASVRALKDWKGPRVLRWLALRSKDRRLQDIEAEGPGPPPPEAA